MLLCNECPQKAPINSEKLDAIQRMVYNVKVSQNNGVRKAIWVFVSLNDFKFFFFFPMKGPKLCRDLEKECDKRNRTLTH